MVITNQEEALHFVDTKLREDLIKDYADTYSGLSLGDAIIEEEAEFPGHKAWRYTIVGLPAYRELRSEWLIDTGDRVTARLSYQDSDTPEKAFAKLQALKQNNTSAN